MHKERKAWTQVRLVVKAAEFFAILLDHYRVILDLENQFRFLLK